MVSLEERSMFGSLPTRIALFLRSEDGPTAAEYAGMLALILIALIASITAVGNSTSGMWQQDANQINSACSNS
jgi:pilus assembly protein Flp/PilA